MILSELFCKYIYGNFQADALHSAVCLVTPVLKKTLASVCIWMGDNRDKIFDFANLIKNQLQFYFVFKGCMHETFLTKQLASRELLGFYFKLFCLFLNARVREDSFS